MDTDVHLRRLNRTLARQAGGVNQLLMWTLTAFFGLALLVTGIYMLVAGLVIAGLACLLALVLWYAVLGNRNRASRHAWR